MPVVVLATRNKGKIAELTEMLRGFSMNVKGLDDFPEVGEIEETGTTFVENALLKARAVCETTGLIAVADDSGLEVDALDGAPGVYSARYAFLDLDGAPPAGDKDALNNAKLIRELAEVPEERRTARFRCVMAACKPGGETLTKDGAWEGRILESPRGENGFGYDPVFFDEELQQTAAEMGKAEKNKRSHRGHALRALLEAWPRFMEHDEQKK